LKIPPAIPSITLKVYDAAMKYVLLAIFVLFAAQPVQVACDMHDDQNNTHGKHGDMNGDDGMDMDCCDDDPSSPSDNCDSMLHCGACAVGVASISAAIVSAAFDVLPTHRYAAKTHDPANRFLSPPFRPPIA